MKQMTLKITTVPSDGRHAGSVEIEGTTIRPGAVDHFRFRRDMHPVADDAGHIVTIVGTLITSYFTEPADAQA